MALIKKDEALKTLGITAKNMGCTSAQIVSLTYRIQSMAEHLSYNKKDHSARRALQCLLGKRRSLLKYCAGRDDSVYRSVLKTLGLRR